MWKGWFEKPEAPAAGAPNGKGAPHFESGFGSGIANLVFGRNAARSRKNSREASGDGGSEVKVLKKGPAMRVIFFYPGEEGTYVDNANVTLFENGIVHIKSNQEETTTHLQNCEILWTFETEADERTTKVRLLKPKAEARDGEPGGPSSPDKPPKGGNKSPELR